MSHGYNSCHYEITQREYKSNYQICASLGAFITMAWSTHYVSPANTLWQGRKNIPENACFFQIIRLLDLNTTITTVPQTTRAFALLGFSCDEGVRRNQGRIGAAEGPEAIRKVLANMPIQQSDILCFDAGDITCTNGDLAIAQITLGNAVNLLLQHHITPIVLGGGHELAYGHYLGIAKTYPHHQLGIVNFDAHFDMRPLPPDQQGNSGTPFLQIAELHKAAQQHFDYNCIGIQPAGNMQTLFNTAAIWQVHTLQAEQIQADEKKLSATFIERIIHENDIIYLSLCLDVFAAAYAPGVSAPQAFGLTPWQVLPLIRQLAASGKIISYDIAELSPPYDIDQRTAKLAANFIYEIIHSHQGKDPHVTP